MGNPSRFKKDQLVRRKAHDGFPIGPYMRITHIGKYNLKVEVLSLNEKDIVLSKEHAYPYYTPSLSISEGAFNELVLGQRICIQHPMCARWASICDKEPELIRFYTMTRNFEVIATVERIEKLTSLREKVIRIVIGNIIYKGIRI